MSIKLSDNIRVGQQKPLEDKYFNELNPYTSTTQVNTLLLKSVRHIGLTVNINGDEYWYKDGIEDENLIKKLDSTIKDYSFYRQQLGFFEYYNNNGQRVKKPYYSQMYKCKPDVDGYYPYVATPNIQKLLEKKVFQDIIQDIQSYYSVVEIDGEYMNVFTYNKQLFYSPGQGVYFESSTTITTVLLTNPSLSETTIQLDSIGTIYIYIEFTSSDDQEIIIEQNLTI